MGFGVGLVVWVVIKLGVGVKVKARVGSRLGSGSVLGPW